MRLIDREDLFFLFVFGVALLVRWSRLSVIRRGAARFLAAIAYRCSRSKRRRVERAVDAIYGGSITATERREIVLGSMRGVWTELFALVSGPLAREDYLPCEIRGLDSLQTSLSAGKGVILWESNGLGARWMPKRFLKEHGFPLHQIHGRGDLAGFGVTDPPGTVVRHRLIRPFVHRCEGYFVGEISMLPGDRSVAIFRELRRRLAENEILCIPGDGHVGHKRVSVPYLGRSIRLATGMVSLARTTGAALHPVFCVPAEGGGYRLTIGERLPASPGGDREADATATVAAFARLLEQAVRSAPEHYRNWHRAADAGGGSREASGQR